MNPLEIYGRFVTRTLTGTFACSPRTSAYSDLALLLSVYCNMLLSLAIAFLTRNSAVADKPRDAFREKYRDLQTGVRGH